MLRRLLAASVLLLLPLSSCGTEKTAAGASNSGGSPVVVPDPDGPQGGWLGKFSDQLHFEVKNDPHVQKVMLWIYEKDRKTAKPISGLPVLVVETKAGERRLSDPLPRDMVEGMASRYVYRDESLKADLIRGRLELELDGKTFAAKVLMEHKHERDH